MDARCQRTYICMYAYLFIGVRITSFRFDMTCWWAKRVFDFVILGKGTFSNYRWNCIMFVSYYATSARSKQSQAKPNQSKPSSFIGNVRAMHALQLLLLLSFFPYFIVCSFFWFFPLSVLSMWMSHINVNYFTFIFFIIFFSLQPLLVVVVVVVLCFRTNWAILCRNSKWNYCFTLLIS